MAELLPVCLRGEKWCRRLTVSIDDGLRDLPAWMDGQGVTLKQAEHSRVSLVRIEGSLCYVKLFMAKSRRQALAYRLGVCRAVHSFDAAVSLAAAGVKVPKPLAVLRVGSNIMLLTEAVEGGVDLLSHWQANRDENCLASAGVALARCHGAGYTHGDCKWSNFLCSDQGIYLVDLESVSAGGSGNGKCWRDLARFALNAEDFAVPAAAFRCFLEAYCELASIDQVALERGVLPPLRRFRERHRLRYGERGHRLFPE